MNHAASAYADLYDREQEQPEGRRREAPDWGGDDLFTTTPRRRHFERPPRGGHSPDRSDHAVVGADRSPARHERIRSRDTMEHPVQRLVVRDVAREAVRRSSPLELPEVTERTIALPEPPPAARRTVTITGHPDRAAARRRPAPSLDERLYGAHPERIAMYAFALGLLLIVIAFLSAS